jgi:hypothetical protein
MNAWMPKTTVQKIATICIVLAVVDILLGQRTLAMVFAGAGIVVSLASSYLTRKSGKGP